MKKRILKTGKYYFFNKIRSLKSYSPSFNDLIENPEDYSTPLENIDLEQYIYYSFSIEFNDGSCDIMAYIVYYDKKDIAFTITNFETTPKESGIGRDALKFIRNKLPYTIIVEDAIPSAELFWNEMINEDLVDEVTFTKSYF